ncbi:NAD(P)-binding domain-containing protein [Halobacteriovorax sp. HLS]|uniref:NAD(P)-binding domain-containing protein n=1 Tax=Halobacteriovorax sp. HLS TaxID=2234000 RepID=UPI000FDB6AFB|nr:NAD(P)-binding domain-containing protein [Halobacteriovorax sp. HLS]
MLKKIIKQIAVIGAGHLGHQLANFLVSKGYSVIASNRTKNKEDKNYKGILFSLENIEKSDEFFFDIDLFIINIPPSQTTTNQLFEFRNKFPNRRFIYISSTSVFENNQGIVNEETIPIQKSARSKNVYEQESIFRKDCIIRCSGLISSTRHPIHSLIKKVNNSGNHPLNLIHIDDVVEIIFKTISNQIFSTLIHATHLNNYTKQEYYSQLAKKSELGEICFNLDSSEGKKVESLTLKKWNYQFKNDLF